jgi:hypothetical protein
VKRTKKELAFFSVLLLITGLFATLGTVNSEAFKQVNFSPQIVASGFSSNGTLFVGGANYTLYRSDNNG